MFKNLTSLQDLAIFDFPVLKELLTQRKIGKVFNPLGLYGFGNVKDCDACRRVFDTSLPLGL
jgi:lipoprotein NlpI